MRRIYAIGDIHGSLSKLHNLIGLCEAEAGSVPISFVFIGDYIDRGPDSRGVVEYVMKLEARHPGQVVKLMGNHEAMALAAVGKSPLPGLGLSYSDPDIGGDTATWLAVGGDLTLQSYGVTCPADLPREHVDWMRECRIMYDDGRRLFVHAGVNPENPLDQQNEADILWIRRPFLSCDRDYGRFIVHGHTPTRTGQPELHSNRLNIDTGAVYGWPLTAAVFNEDQTVPVGFLQAP